MCESDCITKADMLYYIRRVDRPQVSRCIVLHLVLSAFLIFLCFLCNYHHAMSLDKQLLDFAFSGSDPTRNWRSINKASITPEDLKNALVKSNGFLVATRKNRGKASGSVVCVVDPGITDCQGMGFAAFLIYTLEYILLCRALGINRPTVFWRACNSVCSRDPRVNSWDWYFEPVNSGLETEVENVLCPLRANDDIESFFNKAGVPFDVKPITGNSFKNRNDVEGYEDSKIITTKERLRVNTVIHQYIKPNSRVKKKVEMFYQQYLAGFNVLGVHVRGTDHWIETSEKRLPSLMSWVKKAQSILETLPRPRKIFIASDNHEVLKKFVIHFGEELVSITFSCL